jgi:hypothetical protein
MNLACRLHIPQKSVRQFVHVGILPIDDGTRGRETFLYSDTVGKPLSVKAILRVGTAISARSVTNKFTNFSLVCLWFYGDEARVTVSIKVKSRKGF